MDIKSQFSNYIFYTINYKGKMYLGELADSTAKGDFMQYHLDRTNLPFFNSKKKLVEAWEKTLTDDIKAQGFKATSKDFIECKSYNAIEVIGRIQSTLQNAAKDSIIFKNQDILQCLYEALAKIDTIRPIENLLINLLYKENGGAIWNTHANYGSFRKVEGWNLDVPTLQRLQKEAIANKIGLVLTVDFKDAKQFLTEKQLTKFLQEDVLRTTVPIRITSGNVGKFLKLVQSHVSLASLLVIQKKLIAYWEGVPQIVRDQYRGDFNGLMSELENHIEQLEQKYNSKRLKKKFTKTKEKITKHQVRDTKTYKSWLETVDNFTSKVQKSRIALMPEDYLAEFVRIVNKWLQQVNLQQLLGVGQPYDLRTIQDYYKVQMTKWIQNNIFDKFKTVEEYTQKQIDIYKKTIGKKMGQAWLPKNTFTGTDNEHHTTLINRTKSLLPSDNLFFIYAWEPGNYKVSLYGEQVSIWLGTNAPFSQWHDLINVFNHQPQSIKDLDKITVY